MKYDFTSILDRHGRDAIALDGIGLPGRPGGPREGFDAIPMWVADMNFPTAPGIPAAIRERAGHPAFGYFSPTEDYYNAIIRWQGERNGVSGLSKEHIGYENGVLGGGGVWRMDFAGMEKKIVDNRIHAAVFCSPHNPCGRVWERWELERAMELFRKHDVYVVSDEIWSDLTLDGHRHIPTQSVSEDARNRTAALYAPSKTFNLAGLVGSYHIIYNPWLRERVEKESSLCCYNEMNVLSMHALTAAYSPEGAEWLDELRQVLSGNVDFACKFIAERFEGVRVSRPQGTYMLFLDCTDWCAAHGKTIGELERLGWDVGVAWQDGRMFHGPCHIRVNLALPLARVEEAFRRLDKYVFNA